VHVLPTPTSLLARVFTNSAQQRLPYRLWVPTNRLSDGPLPLVLFLHGAGERGSDNLLQLSGQPHALSFVSYQNQETHPCFFVAPQCPANSDWSQAGTLLSVGGMVSNLTAQYAIDLHRLYVTGLSMGGFGTWMLLWQAPGVFAAGAPVCGGGSLDGVPFIKTTPVWNFHSADDPTVPVQYSRSLIEGLRNQGGDPIYTEYASAGHGAWIPAYSTQKLIDWMMGQRLGEPRFGEPRMSFPAGFDNRVARAAVGHFTLQGQVAAFGETITNIVWTNLVLRAGGKALGTNQWCIPDVPLREQETNIIVVTARTASWAPQYGGSTTITKTAFVRGVPPLLLTLEKTASQVRLTWTGGESPYQVQSSADPGLNVWSDMGANATSPLDLNMDDRIRFYRVICP
jgi:predicted esterase